MKIYGRVTYDGKGKFYPEIVALAGDETITLWRGCGFWQAHAARNSLAETVALVGLCFWPPSYMNDNGRELGASPWTNATEPRCPGCRTVGDQRRG